MSTVLRQHGGKFRHVPDRLLNTAEGDLERREGSARPAETSAVLSEPSLCRLVGSLRAKERETVLL